MFTFRDDMNDPKALAWLNKINENIETVFGDNHRVLEDALADLYSSGRAVMRFELVNDKIEITVDNARDEEYTG